MYMKLGTATWVFPGAAAHPAKHEETAELGKLLEVVKGGIKSLRTNGTNTKGSTGGRAIARVRYMRELRQKWALLGIHVPGKRACPRVGSRSSE